MSQENVELVRVAWGVYGDRGIEAALDFFAEDCVSEDFSEMPDGGTYEGRSGALERYQRFAEIWGDFVMELVEVVDAGDGVVVAVAEMRGSGRGSGAPMDAPAAFVYDVRDGRIVRDRAFTSRAAALEAAGLSE
jgi:ketosteroid isomerase-like protein